MNESLVYKIDSDELEYIGNDVRPSQGRDYVTHGDLQRYTNGNYAEHWPDGNVDWVLHLDGEIYYREKKVWRVDVQVDVNETCRAAVNLETADRLNAIIDSENYRYRPCRYCSGDERAVACECV